jgi:hypothetical protein
MRVVPQLPTKGKKMKTSTLTKPQLEAAQRLFEGELSDKAIADLAGVDVRTLRRWQELRDFVDEMNVLRDEFAIHTRRRILASREKRLAEKMDRHQALTTLIKRRAETADPGVPGAETGLLIKKTVKSGDYESVEYRVDYALLRELDRLEADIAKELGQHPPAEEIKEEPEEDLSCLTRDELEIMFFLTNKIALHNPWTIGPLNRQITEYDRERTARLIAQHPTNQAQNT